MNPLRHITTVLAIATLLISLASVSAQQQQGGQAGQGGQGGRGRGGAAFQNMTEEQRTAMQEVNQATRDLTDKLRAANTELGAAVYAAKVDEAQIKEKAAAVAKIQEEIVLARAKAFAKVRSKFSSEIIDALKNQPLGGGGGGGNRRGGRGANNNN